MIKAKKILALLLALVMCLGLFAACGGNTEPQDSAAPTDAPTPADSTEPEEPKTIVAYCTQGLEQKFSPFFAASTDDVNITSYTQLNISTVDRVSNPILTGIEGEVRAYNGTDYTYYTPGNIEITENDDGTVFYDITMRDDIVFSDGTPADIDDVIFATYVVMDPTYDGSTTIYSAPIEGVEEYRAGMSPLYELLVAAGEDNTDFTNWDEAAQTAFWTEGLPAAGAAFAQSIVDYVMTNYADDSYCATVGAETGADLIANEDLHVAFGMAMWGYGDVGEDGALTGPYTGTSWDLQTSFPTAADYWTEIMANPKFEGDYTAASDTEAASSGLWSYLDPEFQKGIQTGESAPSITGIQRTGDYSLRVVATEVDATLVYQMADLMIAPLHYYGDESLYDYENNSFGFPKGDLSIIKAHTTEPMGAGPYIYKGYSNGVVNFEANPSYYLGEPATKYLNIREGLEADFIPGVETGTGDIATPSYSTEKAEQIADINGSDELEGPVITTKLIDFRGYGYVGCNPNLVKVGDDPYSDESTYVRKAILSVIAAYRDEGIDSYYGETASVINYPISNTSWAAPQVTDDGYHLAYSLDVNGDPIYTDGMSAEDKYTAAKEAALAYLEAAGYTVADGKVTAAPEGAKLQYAVEIGGNGVGEHPTFLILKNAADALAEIGITLTINDHANQNDLFATYQNGTAEFWCAAWQAGVDPDMFQVYHSEGATNYYHIYDEELDSLIMEARASTNQTYRKGLYQAAMEIVMDQAVELPVYQRSECIIFSSERIDMESVPNDMTPYHEWNFLGEITKLAAK